MKNLLLNLLLLAATTTARPKRPLLSAEERAIKKEVQYAANYRYRAAPAADLEAFCAATSRKLAAYLAKKVPSSTVCQEVGLGLSVNSKDASAIRIDNFGYDCGGARRYITQPVVQWKNTQGQLFAYSLAKKINCLFYEIHPLKRSSRTLYLLIGREGGSGGCDQNIAYVIELKGNYLLLDVAAFVNRPYVNLCSVELAFNPKSQLLVVSAREKRSVQATSNMKYTVEEQGAYSKSKQANEALLRLLGWDSELWCSTIRLRFNGVQFIR